MVTNIESGSIDVALDEQQDHETFWNKLEVDVEEILAEVDSVTALGSKKRRQPPVAQSRTGILRQTGLLEREEIPIMATAERFSNSHEGAVLRRPQTQDEYWSISPSAWLQTSKPRRIMLSHVGRINETSEGEQAVDGDCTACARSGAECMVYCDEARIRGGDTAGRACSRCRFRGLNCLFDTIKKPGRSKRKRAACDDVGRKPINETRPRRKLRGSDIAHL